MNLNLLVFSPGHVYGILLALAFLFLFATAEILYHRWKVPVEVTRKIVHIVSGLLALYFPAIIGNKYIVLVLCLGFLLILVASWKWNFLPSIQAVKTRKTIGSFIFPIIVAFCYFVMDYFNDAIYFYLPILILAISDPFAAFAGKMWQKKHNIIQKKTMFGSLIFFLSALILSCFVLAFFPHQLSIIQLAVMALCIATVSMLAERYTSRGLDNLTIPISVVLVLFLFFSLFIP